MQLAFYIAGIVAAVIAIVTATVTITRSIEGLRTEIAILTVKLDNTMKRLERMETRHAASA